jgi:hypothetical protein
MLYREIIKEPRRDVESHLRDFITFEDELPAVVLLDPAGPRERATSCTDVKHETTDDN